MNLYDPILFKAVNVNFNYQFFFKMVTYKLIIPSKIRHSSDLISIPYLGLYNVQDFAQIL